MKLNGFQPENPEENPGFETSPYENNEEETEEDEENTERPPGDWQVVEDPLKRLDEIS